MQRMMHATLVSTLWAEPLIFADFPNLLTDFGRCSYGSCMQQETDFSNAHHIKLSIGEAWRSAWDQGKVESLAEIVTTDYRRVNAGSKTASDLEQIQSEILNIRQAFPDLETEIDEILVDGHKAAIYWHTTGTRVVTHGSNLLSIRDGLIEREEATWDSGSLLADLGLKSLSSAFDQESDAAVVENFSGEPSREALKTFNKQFITGVTVVTTVDREGQPRGLAVNSYNSVSLDPPLVLVCIQKSSSTYPAMFQADHFGINIMSRNQRETLGTFASKIPDKFSHIEWHPGEHGSPLIDGSSASIEVEIKERFQALTHTVFLGRVRSAQASSDEPMIYQAGRFFDSLNLVPFD